VLVGEVLEDATTSAPVSGSWFGWLGSVGSSRCEILCIRKRSFWSEYKFGYTLTTTHELVVARI